ncbi:MAG TPA: BMC domain-containing protein, partial [Chondromyces sp.]|nr:BMC domain-containing protein [Chondromyces sp.]
MKALGMIEVVGMAAAVAAADTAVKSANVTLLGYELANGGGMVTIKFEGDVGATKAALEAASIEAERVGKVVSKHLIPRPHEELEKLIPAKETTSESGSSVKKNEKISISQVIEQIEASTITIDGTDNQAESFTEEDSSGDEEPESSLKTD